MDFFYSLKEYGAKKGISYHLIKRKIENNELFVFKNNNKVYIPKNCEEILTSFKLFDDLKAGVQVISIGNYKGGVMKTTNTKNIASILAFYGKKVLIVDNDPQADCTQQFDIFEMGYEKIVTHNTIQLMIDLEILEDDELEKKVKNSIINIKREHINGKLDILPSYKEMVTKIRDIESVTNAESSLDTILNFVKDDYDFVIIDTLPSVGLLLNTALLASDYFLVSLKAEPSSHNGISGVLSPIEKISRSYKRTKGKELRVLGAIVGDLGVSNAEKNSLKQIEETINLLSGGTANVFPTKISSAKTTVASQAGKGAMMYYDFKHKVVYEYSNLVNDIIKNIIQIKYIENME